MPGVDAERWPALAYAADSTSDDDIVIAFGDRYGRSPPTDDREMAGLVSAELAARDAEMRAEARAGGFVDGAKAALNELAMHFEPEAPDSFVLMAELQRWSKHIAETFLEKLSKAVELARKQDQGEESQLSPEAEAALDAGIKSGRERPPVFRGSFADGEQDRGGEGGDG